MTAAKMLVEARNDLGMTGRPNRITRAYSSRNGDVFLEAPWCDQGVTEWGRRSSNAAAVLPRGDRAFTVWHAEDGKTLGLWFAGTAANIKAHAEPGALVFFDWDGTDNIARIDHIGIVERNLGDGRIQSIEANTGDAVKRRVRGSSVIAGFWVPLYAGGSATPARPTPAAAKNPTEVLVNKLPLIKPGAKGKHCGTIFYLLKARGYAKLLDPKVIDPFVYSPPIVAEVRKLQGAKGLKKDGEVGDATWPVLVGV
ncbi:CHAP domain-containing protein [Nonomuraea sp. NPDC026600]|uniref:CHAP domain-containing protein n=1 Tax=Nonomuraea sp. NPDC026600 TaxID=3155363 RepID=UPI0033D84911